ncbi:hypothetical protein [Tepidicaulis sp.]|uniref:hypothetical protein n=1 Tax=Tepidicaulis sp. TaxID=1920809 RepID=UPI003B5C6DB5
MNTLDPSTALGVVAGALLELAPAGGAFEASGFKAIFVASGGLSAVLLGLWILLSMRLPRPSQAAAFVAGLCFLWTALILTLDAFLAVQDLPRLSWAALVIGYAAFAGMVPGYFAAFLTAGLFRMVGHVLASGAQKLETRVNTWIEARKAGR